MDSLLQVAVINLLFMVLYMSWWFLQARRLKRLDLADVAWGGGFMLMATIGVILNPQTATWLIAVLVWIWGLRLALHIARRHRGKQEDPRYTELSVKWRGHFWLRAYLSVFIVQAVLIWLVGMPITIVGANQEAVMGIWPVVGVVIWLIGFAIESWSDRQLSRFVAQPSNKGKVMDQGLWRYSRHPNYFGEITQWWGIWLVAMGTGYGWVGIIGPLTITLLIVFVSGIPPLERRYRDDAAYQSYRQRTSALIPWPPRR